MLRLEIAVQFGERKESIGRISIHYYSKLASDQQGENVVVRLRHD
jgi:hypothetical protein